MLPRNQMDDLKRRNPQQQDFTDPSQAYAFATGQPQAEAPSDNSSVIMPRISPYQENIERAGTRDIGAIVPNRTAAQASALYDPQAQMGHADMGSAITQAGDIGSIAPRNRMDSQTTNYAQEDYNNGLKYSMAPAVAPPADRYQAEQTPVLDPRTRAQQQLGERRGPGLLARLGEAGKAFLLGGGITGAAAGLFDVYGKQAHERDIDQLAENLGNQDKQLIQRNQANLSAEKFNDLQSQRESERAFQERQFQQTNENHSIAERRHQQALADSEEKTSIAQRQSQSKIDELGRHNKEREDAHRLASEVQGIYQRMKTTTPNSTDMLVMQQRLAEINKQPFTSEQAEVMRDRGILGKDSSGNQILINPYSGEAKNVTMAGSGVNGQPSINVRVYNAPSRGGGGGGGASSAYDDVEAQRLLNSSIKIHTDKLSERDKRIGKVADSYISIPGGARIPIKPGEDPHEVLMRNGDKLSDPVYAALTQVYRRNKANSSIHPRPSTSAFSGNPNSGNQ